MPMHLETKRPNAVPAPARILGFAGLIPFVFGALAVAFAPEIKPEAAAALLLYGALILSFLGGVRWGFAVIEGENAGWNVYGVSVVPPLAAWVAAAGGGPAGLLILAIALGLWYGVERALPPALSLPAWYTRLRGILSAAAVASLLFAAVSW
jgi:Protein of unknown function (DUF3429)